MHVCVFVNWEGGGSNMYSSPCIFTTRYFKTTLDYKTA